ncbi:MAG: hypothetical protein ACXU8P_13775 [Phenylobacterium sp.]
MADEESKARSGLFVDESEDAFAAAMMRIAQPLDDKDEADAEYAAAEALKLSAPTPRTQGAPDDDMPAPMDYEGED